MSIFKINLGRVRILSCLVVSCFFSLSTYSCFPEEEDSKDTYTDQVNPGDTYTQETSEPGAKTYTYIFPYYPYGSGEKPYGDNKGFFKVTTDGGQATIVRLNDFYPIFNDSHSVNANGTVAFTCLADLLPEDAPKYSKLAYFSISSPHDVTFVAPPPKPVDWYWNVGDGKPFIIQDGRIISLLSLAPDVYGSGSKDHLGIYDPTTDTWTISPDVSGFVLAQPEQGWDTEAGVIRGGQALSPDQTKVYLTLQGWGVDGGSNHYDETFLAYYDIATNEFVRVYRGSNVILTATNQSVYFSTLEGEFGDGIYAVDIDTKTVTKLEDFNSSDWSSSPTRDEIVKVWRGSGLGTFTKSGTGYDWKHIINPDNFTERTYTGLKGPAYYTENEDALIFAVSKDYNTNYDQELAVMKSPLITENPDPEVLFYLPANFKMNFTMVR